MYMTGFPYLFFVYVLSLRMKEEQESTIQTIYEVKDDSAEEIEHCVSCR